MESPHRPRVERPEATTQQEVPKKAEDVNAEEIESFRKEMIDGIATQAGISIQDLNTLNRDQKAGPDGRSAIVIEGIVNGAPLQLVN